jgi:glycosyltransferase involved in cell wall biosynthesis
MTISVIIPAYNEEKYLGACLHHVLRHAGPNVLEVLVIDNASTDRTSQVAGRFPKVRVVREPDKGLTKARQRGLVEARGDLLAYIDADCKVPETWFTQITREFNSNATLVCLSGPYIYEDLSGWRKVLVRLYWLVLAKPVYAVTRYMVVGGNFVAKKQALIAMGGFDKSIPFYGEDTNIARRLHGQGQVKFSWDFSMVTSGRRLNSEGQFQTALRYGVNYLWMALFNKPFTTRYQDIR